MIRSYVNGKTKVFGVIGDPIEHSFSPIIHNSIAEKFEHNMIYIPLHVNPENLEKSIVGAYALNIRGLNVTIPHKQQVIPFLTGLSPTAQQIGSVNTLCYTPNGYIGHNTDCVGLTKLLETQHVRLQGCDIVILGAGGSAYAAAMMAINKGARHIFVANRTLEKAQNLVNHFQQYVSEITTTMTAMTLSDLKYIPAAEIVIQTTALGFGAQASLSPVTELSFFKKVNVALDIIYTPWQTQFLSDAATAGCICINGFAMLVYQALAAYEIWHDIKIEHSEAIQLEAHLRQIYESEIL